MTLLASLTDLSRMACSAVASLSTLSTYLVLQVTHLDPFCSATIDLGALELGGPVVVPNEFFQVLPALSDRYRTLGGEFQHIHLSLTGAAGRTDENKVRQPARHLFIQRLGLFLPRIRLYELTASAHTEDAEALGPQCVDALAKAHEEEVAQRGRVSAVAEECREDGTSWN